MRQKRVELIVRAHCRGQTRTASVLSRKYLVESALPDAWGRDT